MIFLSYSSWADSWDSGRFRVNLSKRELTKILGLTFIGYFCFYIHFSFSFLFLLFLLWFVRFVRAKICWMWESIAYSRNHSGELGHPTRMYWVAWVHRRHVVAGHFRPQSQLPRLLRHSSSDRPSSAPPVCQSLGAWPPLTVAWYRYVLRHCLGLRVRRHADRDGSAPRNRDRCLYRVWRLQEQQQQEQQHKRRVSSASSMAKQPLWPIFFCRFTVLNTWVSPYTKIKRK